MVRPVLLTTPHTPYTLYTSLPFPQLSTLPTGLSDLRRQVAVVPQETVLFNHTLGYNLQYGNISSDQAAVQRAVEACKLDRFVAKMPDGLDTRVGERGLKLSGGEKQRVGIARAMLKDSPILFCDEATSALDAATEADIVHDLRQAALGRTTIIIAHRLSTVRHADRIVGEWVVE